MAEKKVKPNWRDLVSESWGIDAIATWKGIDAEDVILQFESGELTFADLNDDDFAESLYEQSDDFGEYADDNGQEATMSPSSYMAWRFGSGHHEWDDEPDCAELAQNFITDHYELASIDWDELIEEEDEMAEIKSDVEEAEARLDAAKAKRDAACENLQKAQSEFNSAQTAVEMATSDYAAALKRWGDCIRARKEGEE